MRKRELIIYIPVLILLVLVSSAFIMNLIRDHDTQPPVITVPSQELSVSVHDPETVLLKDVSASDNMDGDVSGQLIVEHISNISDDFTAQVTYAAVDSSGNVAKATRTVRYADYAPPVFNLYRPLIFVAGSSADVLSRITAVDVLDGDISKNIKATLAGDSAGLNVVGTHQVSFRVTNSMGDTARITLPVDILPANTYTGQVELKANLIRLQVGDSFDPEQYFKHLAVGGGKFTLDDGVQLRITNLVDTETAGVYSATITASYGTAMAFTRIIVIVE